MRLIFLLLAMGASTAWADAAEPEPFAITGDDPLNLTVGHSFSTRAEARLRVSQMLEYWGKRFGVKSEWHGDRAYCSGRMFGVDFRARFDVADSEVTAKATNPGMLLRGSAYGYVEKKLKKYLHPKYEEPQ